MNLPLQTFVSTALLVATAGLATADPNPQPLYFLVNPDTGESWQTDGDWFGSDTGERDDTTVLAYEALYGQDNDGDGQNFADDPNQLFSPQASLIDDYEMTPAIDTTQTLVTHAFRAGFGDGDNNTPDDGRLYVTFYDASGTNEVSSYLVNLTGNEGFNTIVVSFTSDVLVEPMGRVEFDWRFTNVGTEFGLMETEPQIGFNEHELFWDGANQVTPPSGAWGGISQQMITAVPAPGSLAPVALAGFGLLTRRRKS